MALRPSVRADVRHVGPFMASKPSRLRKKNAVAACTAAVKCCNIACAYYFVVLLLMVAHPQHAYQTGVRKVGFVMLAILIYELVGASFVNCW